MKILPYQILLDFHKKELIKIKKISDIQSCSVDVSAKLNKPLIIKKNTSKFIEIEQEFKNLDNNNLIYSSKSTTARNFIKIQPIQNRLLKITPLAYDIIINSGDYLGQFYIVTEPKYENSRKIQISLNDIGYIMNKDSNNSIKIDNLTSDNCYLMKSNEEVKIEKDECGILLDHSLYDFHVLTHINAGFFDAGFTGKAVFEIITHKDLDISKEKNHNFAQLNVFKLLEPTEKPYNNNYQKQDKLQSILPVKSFKYVS